MCVCVRARVFRELVHECCPMHIELKHEEKSVGDLQNGNEMGWSPCASWFVQARHSALAAL